jgi:ribosomal protein S27E
VTAGKRHLVCPYGCQPGRFELIGGAVFVDPRGLYLSHEERLASFRCESCGSVAVDLAEAAAARARESGSAGQLTVTCPACGTRLLPPLEMDPGSQLECPNCGAVFSFEEGSQHLLGNFSEAPEDLSAP